MLKIENSRYRAELMPARYGLGKLSFFYKEGFKVKSSKVEPDTSVDHSYSVLEGIFKGEFPSVPKSRQGPAKEIRERFFNSTGVGKLPQNLSYLLLNEFPIFFSCPDFNNGYAPMNENSLKSFFEERGAPIISNVIKINLSWKDEDKLFKSFNYHKKEVWENSTEILESNSKTRGFKHEVVDLLDAYRKSLFFIDVFVRTNSRLVLAILNRNKRAKQEKVNLGFMALRKAAINFDFNRGNKFSTYAYGIIKKELAKDKLYRESYQHHSLEDYHEEDTSVYDAREDYMKYLAEVAKNILYGHHAGLSKKEERIVEKRFGFSGEPMILKDLGEELGITKERVRQIEKEALIKLGRVLMPRLEKGSCLY